MVVFFDIDGTLVDDDTQIIPESAVRAVEQLVKNGHTAVVNTGRLYTHVDPRVRKMAFSGFVCGCGTEIRLGDEWLSRTVIGLDVCQYAWDAVRECRMEVMYEADGALLTDGDLSVNEHNVTQAKRLSGMGLPVKEISELPEPRFMKFVTHDTEHCDREGFIRKMEPYFTCIHRENTMLEMVPKGCSKAAGLERMLTHLGASKEDTLAIGDSTNDLPMFAVAGHTACMGGGAEEVKAVSEFITDTVLNDGIEKALKHFGLI